MANLAGKVVMKALTIAVGIPVGVVTKKSIETVWSTTHPDDPPRKPKDPNVRWRDAIGWAALSAVGVVAADLITRRGAEEVWRIVLGTEPPQPKSKDEKKQEELSSTT
jgi:hypothetical protein